MLNDWDCNNNYIRMCHQLHYLKMVDLKYFNSSILSLISSKALKDYKTELLVTENATKKLPAKNDR